MRNVLTLAAFKDMARGLRDAGQTFDASDLVVRIPAETEIKEVDAAARSFEFTISTPAVDRMGDTIALDGWQLDNFRKNPVVLWAHDYHSLPLARAENTRVEDGKLKSVAVFTPEGMAKFNDMVFEMVKGRFLHATSVGFRPIDWEWSREADRQYGIDFKTQELLEYSVVPVPAHQDALIEPGQRATIEPKDDTPSAAWQREIARRRLAMHRAGARG